MHDTSTDLFPRKHSSGYLHTPLFLTALQALNKPASYQKALDLFQKFLFSPEPGRAITNRSTLQRILVAVGMSLHQQQTEQAKSAPLLLSAANPEPRAASEADGKKIKRAAESIGDTIEDSQVSGCLKSEVIVSADGMVFADRRQGKRRLPRLAAPLPLERPRLVPPCSMKPPKRRLSPRK